MKSRNGNLNPDNIASLSVDGLLTLLFSVNMVIFLKKSILSDLI